MQKKLALQDKLRTEGLVGHRIGKHMVREEEPTVQLGEDLSESLRGLKVCCLSNSSRNEILLCLLQVEGNLFKDRYLSLQHRALLEPRKPVLYVELHPLFRVRLNQFSADLRGINQKRRKWRNSLGNASSRFTKTVFVPEIHTIILIC